MQQPLSSVYTNLLTYTHLLILVLHLHSVSPLTRILLGDGLSLALADIAKPQSMADAINNALNIQIYRSLESYQRHELHLSYLNRYEQNGIVPKGLLIKKQSCFTDDDPRWQKILWSTAKQLLHATIQQVTEKVKRINSNLQRKKNELWKSTNPADYHRTMNSLHNEVHIESIRLKQIKDRKFERDVVNCQKLKNLIDETPQTPNANQPVDKVKPNRHFRKRKLTQKRKENKTARTPLVHSSQPTSPINKNASQNPATNNGIPNPETTQKENAPCTVMNLSNYTLSPPEINLLSKGLKFCPTPPQIDQTQTKKDLNAFERRMLLKAHFA